MTRVKALVAENEASIKSLVNMLPKAAGTAAEVHIIHEIDPLHAQGEKLKQQLQEQLVICMRYGLQGYRPSRQREVAEKTGISRSYVSRVEKRALQKLKKKIETGA